MCRAQDRIAPLEGDCRTLKKLVIIQQLVPDAYAALNERPDIDWKVVEHDTPERLAAAIAGAHALTVRVGELTEAVLDAAPNLRVISRHGVGYDNVPVDYCTKRGIAIAITPDANSTSVAEHAIHLMLAAARGGMRADAEIRKGNYGFRSQLFGLELCGKTLLVVGHGRIGRKVASLAAAFGMEVLVHDPYVPIPESAGRSVIDRLEDGLEQADIVTLHLPLTEETRGMLGPGELDLLRKNAIVINVSRGGLVDESALIERVADGRLFGAGLDTFVEEPLPDDSPLLVQPRIVLSPHSAALTDNSLRAMGILTVKNAIAGIDGTLDPRMVINPEALG